MLKQTEIKGLIRSTATGEILYLESCLNLLQQSREELAKNNNFISRKLFNEITRLIELLEKELN